MTRSSRAIQAAACGPGSGVTKCGTDAAGVMRVLLGVLVAGDGRYRSWIHDKLNGRTAAKRRRGPIAIHVARLSRSPGERARVHVAAMVAAGADLILLDEPTNHLDFDTLEVIEAALRAYRGTIVVASHDRRLHEAIGCDRVIAVRDGIVA